MTCRDGQETRAASSACVHSKPILSACWIHSPLGSRSSVLEPYEACLSDVFNRFLTLWRMMDDLTQISSQEGSLQTYHALFFYLVACTSMTILCYKSSVGS